jgi:hypothetical protein
VTSRRVEVIITQSFELDLERIDRFFATSPTPDRVNALVDVLNDELIPLLERLPRVGRPFDRSTLSGDSAPLFDRIEARLRSREARVIGRDAFAILYVVSEKKVFLVGLKHHREATFRFGQGT